MVDALWTIITGLIMLVPGLNMIVGACNWGWGGFFVGLIITLLASD